ncbi:hypothetical protein [Poseidonibacter ostreae]|uniref:Uncharacterized protein n=1 Tax=Poseidonibacter ostreae TaxID=2654171 RepID=A0A6L4WMS6_9BACT|nr:hypothetical protein [Poseidonibacter ostreae]KAB7880545.1 hypothetical protein GA417_14520 [Poseidonibacter ostreae]KAB7881934.1 hypothetical protein GBG19_16510 [Poseidonibacter ostreae]KAB7885270.1 hypothetical protein GBG18_15010 [Poseidonibacter ostreae]
MQKNAKREEAIYIVGLLGALYNEKYIESTIKMLENNNFEDLLEFIEEVDIYKLENDFKHGGIWLIPPYPFFKLWDMDVRIIEDLLAKHNLNLKIVAGV